MKLKIVETGSKGNTALLIDKSGRMLMLDAGASYDNMLRAIHYNISSVDGCLISHMGHKDHSRSVPELKKSYMDVYGADKTDNMSGRFGNWSFAAFSLEHDVDNLGYFIQNSVEPDQRIAYLIDTGYIRYRFEGMTVLIIECNYVDEVVLEKRDELDARFLRLEKYHMSLDRVKSYLTKIDRSKLHTVVLVHLSDSNADEARMIREVKEVAGCEVVAAHDGDMINLDLVPF